MVDALLDELRIRSGASISVQPLEVAFRETFLRTVEQDQTHKQRTGESGQYALVKIRFAPLPRGTGFMFEDLAAGDTVPKEYVAAIARGLRSAMSTGVLAGYPTIDIRASLVDGAFHSTGSSESVFEIAARACFREGVAKASPVLLEPVMRVEMIAPAEVMRELMDELGRRRGMVTTIKARNDVQVVSALVPAVALFGFHNSHRSRSRARAICSVRFDQLRPVPEGPAPNGIHPGGAIGLRACPESS